MGSLAPAARRLRVGMARLAVAGLAAAAALPAHGQSLPDTPFGETTFPGGIRRDSASVPRLVLRLDRDIRLPGPLPGESPRLLADATVEIPVAGALARTDLAPGGALSLVEASDAGVPSPSPSDWVVSPSGRRRVRTRPDGTVLAQKCCAVDRHSWYQVWRLRLPGGTVAPPLVTDRAVFVPALDNQVYAVRARNGYRLWTADLGHRLSTPLALWRGPVLVAGERDTSPRQRTLELVLAVPDGGSQLIALDVRSGARVAAFELPEDGGRLVGAPLVAGDGRVVVARQRYERSEASLLVLRLEPPAGTSAGGGPAVGSAHQQQHVP